MNTTSGQLDAKGYIEQRVDEQLAYYRNAANQAKRKYTWMQTGIIILGLLVPVAINLPESWGENLHIDKPIK